MYQQSFNSVAHRGAGALGVDRHLYSHVKIGTLVHVEMAVPCSRLNDGHARVLHHGADEALAAAGHQHVHVAAHIHEGIRACTVGLGDKSDQIGGKSVGNQGFLHGIHQRGARMHGFLTTAKHHGVARLEAEGGGIHGHVGARLVNDRHATQRGADVLDDQPVGANGALTRADGVGQGGDLTQSVANTTEALFIQLQAIHHGLGHAVFLGGIQVFLVGGENVRHIRHDLIRHGAEQRVLSGGIGGTVGTGCLLGGLANILNVKIHFVFLFHDLYFLSYLVTHEPARPRSRRRRSGGSPARRNASAFRGR